MCVPWELNPQPFALLTQCSITEPQEHFLAHNATFDIICRLGKLSKMYTRLKYAFTFRKKEIKRKGKGANM